MIHAVTFDVWETMIHDDPALSEVRSVLRLRQMAGVLRDAGIEVDETKLRLAYDDSWREMEEVWATGREVDTPEQVALVLRLLDPGIPPKLGSRAWTALEEAYVAPVHTEPPALAEDLPAVLEGLRADGVSLGLICNTGRTPGYAMRTLLGERYGVLRHFDALAFSNEEAVRKPDPVIFRRVLDKLGVAPGHAVHIGDDLRADITGAKRTGMRAILIRQDCPPHPPAQPDAHIRGLSDLAEALRQIDS